MQSNFYTLLFLAELVPSPVWKKYISAFQTVQLYNLCYATY